VRRAAILVVLASLLAAGDATASPAPAALPKVLLPRLLTQVGAPLPPPSQPFRSGFRVNARGYEVKVFTYGTAVILETIRNSRRRASGTLYVARGVAKVHRLQATFGNLGKVSMRFRAPPRRPLRSLCRFGQRLARRPGSYLGHLSFKGEDGYLSLDLHRASGNILTPAGRCPRRHLSHAEVEKEIEELFAPTTGLFAGSREGVTSTSFTGFEANDRSFFFAAHRETHGKLAILRFVLAEGSKGLRVNEAVTAIDVSPPSPFNGTGRYRAAPDGATTWTGSLSVNFLGAPRTPLTGPDFETLLEVPF
jgi:hypothetical protein